MSSRGARLILGIGLFWPLAGPVTAQSTQGNQSPAVNAQGNVAINYSLTLTEEQITGIVNKLAEKLRASGVAPAGLAASLRLVQVVPRLPTLNLYAIARNEAGTPVALQSGGLSARIGGREVSVEVSRKDEGIGIVFLVDCSASLNLRQFNLVKVSALAWIDSLGPLDRAAIVTFGERVQTVQDFTADKQALRAAIGKLAPRDQRTLLYQGLVRAIDFSRRPDATLPLRRAIVVLTDGLDDQQGSRGRQEVVDKLAVDPTPIYGIGASSQHNFSVDDALDDFEALAHASGGDFRRVDFTNLDKVYVELRRIAGETRHLTASCPDCSPDGRTAGIRLSIAEGSLRFTSERVTVRMVGADGR
jgi:Mg-chelatase subunit ChlD